MRDPLLNHKIVMEPHSPVDLNMYPHDLALCRQGYGMEKRKVQDEFYHPRIVATRGSTIRALHQMAMRLTSQGR